MSSIFGLGSSTSLGAQALGAKDGASGLSGITKAGFNAKLPFGHSLSDRVNAAGLGRFITGGGDQDLRNDLNNMNSAINGMRNTGNELGNAFGTDLSDLMRSKYAGGIAQSKGADRMSQVLPMLHEEGKTNARAKELFDALNGAKTDEERYAILASAEKGAGIAEGARIGNVTQLPAGLQAALRGGGEETDNERMKRYGDTMIGRKAEEPDSMGVSVAKWGARAVGAVLTGGASLAIEGGLRYFGKTDENRKSSQAAQYLLSKEGMKLSNDILGGADRTRGLVDQISNIQGKDEVSNNQRQMLQQVLGANRAILEMNKTGKDLSEDRLKEIAKAAGTTVEGMRGAVGSMSTSVREQQAINRREALAMFAGGAQNERGTLQRAGYLDSEGNISKEAAGKMYQSTGVAMSAGEQLSRHRNNLRNLQAKGGTTGMSDDATRALMSEIQEEAGKANALDYSMSIQDLRAHAKAERGAGNWGESQRASEIAGFRSRGERTLRARGGALGTASILGLKVGREDAKELRNAKDGDGKLASYLESTYGVTDTSAMDKELRQLEIAEKGGGLNVKNARRMSELKEQIGAAKAGDADVKDLISKVGNAKTPKEKMEAIANLKSNTAFQEKEKEREHKSQMNDPNLRALDGIKTEVGKLLVPLRTIAQNLPKPEGL